MKFRYILFSLLLATGISSCSSAYKNLSIETSHPPKQMLPSNIQSLALIDRATTKDFTSYDQDETQQYFYNKNFDAQAVMLDSLASDTTLKSLGRLLYDSGAYDVVIPEDRYYPHTNKFYETPPELDWTTVENICADYQTDAVLALERYYTKIMTSYKVYKSAGYANFAVATVASKYNVVAKVYDPSKREVVERVVVGDTLIWQQDGTSTKEIFLNLPRITEAITETAIQSALDIDAKLSPSWVRSNRIFYIMDKNKESDGAKTLLMARDQEWDDLYAYWMGYEKDSKASTKSKAEFNLALASEMLGDIDQAISWINKSIETKYMQQAKNYMDILVKRKALIDSADN